MSGLFSSNLLRRILTALVLLPAVIAVIAYFPQRGPWALAAILCLIGMGEARALLAHRPLQPSLVSFLPGIALFLELAGSPDARVFPVSGFPILAVVVAALITVVRAERFGVVVIAADGGGALCGLMIGLAAGSFSALASLSPVEEGTSRIALLLAVVISSDVFAYFVGRAMGRHKLAPQVSPGKTIEGAIGGLIGAALASGVVATQLFQGQSVGLLVTLGIFAAIAGIVGDLLESLFKRYVGTKDSGTLFPGHGGALDRIDGFILAAPLMYAFFRAAS